MKMFRDVKESLEMLLITRTEGEEGSESCGCSGEAVATSPGWAGTLGLAGTPGAVRGAEYHFLLSAGPAFRNLQPSGKE